MKLRAKVQNHRLVFDQDHDWLNNAFLKLEGKNVIVDVDLINNKRSLNQNSYYYLCLTVIAAETGNDIDTLHRLFKSKFLKKKVVVWKDKKYEMPVSTTELTKGEFVSYMMEISAEVADYGIILPNPEDYGSDL